MSRGSETTADNSDQARLREDEPFQGADGATDDFFFFFATDDF